MRGIGTAVRPVPTPISPDGLRSMLPPSVMAKGKKRREPRGSDRAAGTAGERLGGNQSRLNEVAYEISPQMDGRKLWKREPVSIPRVTENAKIRADRLKTLGNAVCSPQVYPILKCIMDIETGTCKNTCELYELCLVCELKS